jgi:hypothetical protein
MAIPDLPVPESVRAWFGDCRWWDRPGAFSDPNCRRVVPDLDAAVSQLRALYDEVICRRLVDAGHGRMIFGLFGGFHSWVDKMLQLGADLTLCDGWELRPKLVGHLRSPYNFNGSRFEVGVWAGLVRVGLAPRIEDASDPSKARADFVVAADGIDVALELKALADPASERNRLLVTDALGNLFVRTDGKELRGHITLKLSDEGRARLDDHTPEFVRVSLPTFRRELLDAVSLFRPGGSVTLPTVGLLMADPATDGHSAGSSLDSFLVDPGEWADPVTRVQRALYRVKQAERQLSATAADLRVAVIWGSRDELPATQSADVAAMLVQDEQAVWEKIPVDWTVFLNGHRRDRRPGWTTEVALCRLPNARVEIPPRVLHGLTEWGVQCRGGGEERSASVY